MPPGTAAAQGTVPEPLRNLSGDAGERLRQVREGLRSQLGSIDVEHITGVEVAGDSVIINTDFTEANRTDATTLCRRAHEVGVGRAAGTSGRVVVRDQTGAALAECS